MSIVTRVGPSAPAGTSTRAPAASTTIGALVARVSSGRAGRTRAMRTLDAAEVDVDVDVDGGAASGVIRRFDHHVKVAGLKSRFAQNSVAGCPLRFHAVTRSAQISAVVMLRSVKLFAQIGPTAP